MSTRAAIKQGGLECKSTVMTVIEVPLPFKNGFDWVFDGLKGVNRYNDILIYNCLDDI